MAYPQIPRCWATATLVVAALFGATACAPLNQQLRIDDAPQGSPARAEFSINWNTATSMGTQLTIRGPQQAFTGSLATPQTLVDPASPANLVLLSPGVYYGNMNWDYRRLFSGTTESKSASASFQVLEPNGCFSFDFASANSINAQGWSFDKYYLGETTTLASQTGQAQMQLANNQMTMFVVPNELRLPSTEPFWRVDMNSPALEANPGWANAQGVSFDVGARFATQAAQLKVQPVLTVRKADGTVAKFAEIDAAGNRVFRSLGQWTNESVGIPLPAGSRVLNVALRVWGAMPLPPGQSIQITFDNVCPRP